MTTETQTHQPAPGFYLTDFDEIPEPHTFAVMARLEREGVVTAEQLAEIARGLAAVGLYALAQATRVVAQGLALADAQVAAALTGWGATLLSAAQVIHEADAEADADARLRLLRAALAIVRRDGAPVPLLIEGEG